MKNTIDLLMEAENVPGQITIIQGKKENKVIKIAAELILRYSDNKKNNRIIVYGTKPFSLDEFIIVDNKKDQKMKQYIL